jgi:hypothetical protein
MKPPKYNVTQHRGDTDAPTFVLRDTFGVPIDLRGAQVELIVSSIYGVTRAILSSASGGMTETLGQTGEVKPRYALPVYAALGRGRYVYSLVMIDTLGVRHTVLSGGWIIV